MARVDCEVCGFAYCPDIGADRRQHSKWHDAAVAARAALGFAGPVPVPLPIHPGEIEDLKRGDNRTLINVMWSHFARSLAAWGYDVAVSTRISRVPKRSRR
jgi:hypothetical protein